MIKVYFHSNPNQPKEHNHWGRFAKLTEQDCREFNSVEDAIEFWLNCSYPITKLSEIGSSTYNEKVLEVIQDLYNEDIQSNQLIEEYLDNQKALYALLDEDSII
jgi:hypothetical protein